MQKISQNLTHKIPFLICLALFIAVFAAVETGAFTPLDNAVNNFFSSYNSPKLIYTAMLIVTLLSSPIAILIFSIVIFILLVQFKMKRPAILFSFSVSSAFLVETLLKILINRERPANALLHSITSSFPSGHATVSTAFFVALFFTLQNHKLITKREKIAMLIAFPLAVFLICLSRLFFHMHWLSDVIAGIFLGLAIAFAFRYKL